MPEVQYVACVVQSGRVFRSQPDRDRAAVEAAAAEAGGWVEPVSGRCGGAARRRRAARPA